MRDVIEEKIDSRGRIQVKTFGGKSTSTLAKEVDKFPLCPSVKHVHLHAGFNDCVSLNPMTRTSISMLIDSTERKFPNAKVTFSLVLPTQDGLNDAINKFNETCKNVCTNKKVEALNFGDYFKESELFNADSVHLSDVGTDLMEDLLCTLFSGQSADFTAADERGAQIPVIENGSTDSDKNPNKPAPTQSTVPLSNPPVLHHTEEA